MTRIDQIKAELTEIEEQREWPARQADDLRALIAAKRSQALSRDWVLSHTTASRPRDTPIDGTHEGTARVRAQFLREVISLEQQLRDVEALLADLRGRETPLQEELRILQRDSITPDMLAGQIKAANGDLAQFKGSRHKKAKDLEQAHQQRERVSEAFAAEEQAQRDLERAQAAAFLESAEGETPAVATAKRALQVARDKASTARAALPEIERRVSVAQQALDTFDDECARRRQRVAELERQLAILKARLQFNAAVEAQRAALCELYAVHPDAALQQGEALCHRGLYVLDGDGRLQQPDWLKGAHNPGTLRRALAQGAL